MEPVPGEEFRVGTNWSSQVRKIASVNSTTKLAGETVYVVTDDFGSEKILRESKAALDTIRWFSI